MAIAKNCFPKKFFNAIGTSWANDFCFCINIFLLMLQDSWNFINSAVSFCELQKINDENSAKTSSESSTSAGPSTSTQPADDDKDKEDDKDAKKKKNRCAECRKKVGLTGVYEQMFYHSVCLLIKINLPTGFQCRCGGLYCAVHRYSDKHHCTFNYREHGAQEIRRNNPVVVGEKIQKIWTFVPSTL